MSADVKPPLPKVAAASVSQMSSGRATDDEQVIDRHQCSESLSSNVTSDGSHKSPTEDAIFERLCVRMEAWLTKAIDDCVNRVNRQVKHTEEHVTGLVRGGKDKGRGVVPRLDALAAEVAVMKTTMLTYAANTLQIANTTCRHDRQLERVERMTEEQHAQLSQLNTHMSTIAPVVDGERSTLAPQMAQALQMMLAANNIVLVQQVKNTIQDCVLTVQTALMPHFEELTQQQHVPLLTNSNHDNGHNTNSMSLSSSTSHQLRRKSNSNACNHQQQAVPPSKRKRYRNSSALAVNTHSGHSAAMPHAHDVQQSAARNIQRVHHVRKQSTAWKYRQRVTVVDDKYTHDYTQPY
jgi:hypothetical protein